MDITSSLVKEETWLSFLREKASGAQVDCKQIHDLEQFIHTQAYRPYAVTVKNGSNFSAPQKVALSKMGSDKKRIVYIFPKEERTVLKLITFLLQRKYDYLFSKNLYSFRPGISVRNAVEDLKKIPDIFQMWGYKVDIRDYFNSIPVDRMIHILHKKLPNERKLTRFFKKLLENPELLDRPLNEEVDY